MDTVIVSGLARGDIAESELAALEDIWQAYQDGRVELFASDIVGEELAKVPAQYRDAHLEVYELFRQIPKVGSGALTELGPHGLPMANSRNQTWRRLVSILPDEIDCEHLLTAQFNRLGYFVTLDIKTILNRRDDLIGVIGVRPLRPSELREKLLEGEV